MFDEVTQTWPYLWNSELADFYAFILTINQACRKHLT